MGATVSIGAAIVKAGKWLIEKLKPPQAPAPIPGNVINNVVNVCLNQEQQQDGKRNANVYQTMPQTKRSKLKKKIQWTRKRLAELEAKNDERKMRWRLKRCQSLRQELELGQLEYLKEEARTTLGLDFENCYNVAITGQAGAGKSTLINALCHFDPAKAKVDITECTSEIKRYVYPEIDHLVLWDFPGAGTLDHPIKTYFMDKMLYAFDFLIILFTERFKEIEADLIEKAMECSVPVACVRNKANHDLESTLMDSAFKDRPSDEAKKYVISKLRRNITENLRKCNIVKMPPVFIINALAFQCADVAEFEEVQLEEHVVDAIVDRRSVNQEL